MPSTIFNLLPNLEPFDYERHYDSLFLNQEWVLVNGLSKKKAVYIFKDENTLNIFENESTTETSWCIDIKNTFSIQTQDGVITVKAYFKDDDVLVLNHQNSSECALFINESSYSNSLRSLEDVKQFLKDKYKDKASKLINDHEFYYIEKSEEFGPYTVQELADKVRDKMISVYCFVRDINEGDYSKRLRIYDLIKAI